MKKHLLPAQRSAFSLIELVVVIAIIAIIATFTVPAATTILRGSAITQASQTLTDSISLARQMALSKNRAIEVRFYQYADPETPGEVGPPANPQWRALQLFEVLESGTPVPVGKVQTLPISVVMNPGAASANTLSSLILCDAKNTPTITKGQASTNNPDLPRGIGKNYSYVAFRFQQDGSTNLSPSNTWFVTIHNLTPPVVGTTPPANFFTLQIDPVSGAIKGFRPTAG